MSKLVWRPQKAFADYFYTTPEEIIANRSVFRKEYDHFVSYGGRGSAKTFTWADAVVVEATLRPVRVLVTRELQNSIDESIKAELEAAIESRGVNSFFRILKTEIVGLNGSKFIFKGLKNNINNLKSVADVEIVLCEEAENISKNSWDKLLPSIRPRSGDSPKVIVIFNPEDELDDTYQRWVISPPPRTLSKCINFRENKYFPDHLERQRQHCLKTRPKKEYDHIWEGKPVAPNSDVIIDIEWVKAARFASEHPQFIKEGRKKTSYDPAGQGKDYHAVVNQDGNIIDYIEEWPISPDLRKATDRAIDIGLDHETLMIRYDECGGYGDGVDVFVTDKMEAIISGLEEMIAKDRNDKALKARLKYIKSIEVLPFNAGDSVVNPGGLIEGTGKTWVEMYANAKAQGWAVTAQKLYNTYRFIRLGEVDMDPSDMLSINISDDQLFNKLAKELSTPIWVKSDVNSKRKVEGKKAMEKRTGQPSGNMADGVVMNNAPINIVVVDDSIAGPVTTG